jgi:hypothetical protein
MDDHYHLRCELRGKHVYPTLVRIVEEDESWTRVDAALTLLVDYCTIGIQIPPLNLMTGASEEHAAEIYAYLQSLVGEAAPLGPLASDALIMYEDWFNGDY